MVIAHNAHGYVGESALLYEDVHPQPLCQLRDRTPDTNWTVVANDVPDFFIKRSEILAKYENDPLQRVPITHRQAPTRPSTPASSEQHNDPVDVIESIQGERARASQRALRSVDLTQERASLLNVRDVVLPEHREQDVLRGPHASQNFNDKVYGLERIWVWMLKVHGLYGNYIRPPQAGERCADSASP